MKTKSQKISVKAILSTDGKVLMLKDGKGKWELPGGGIEIGETIPECLQREMREELGISKIKIDEPIHVWTFTSETEYNVSHFVIAVMACSINESEFEISDEHVDMSWIDPNDLDSYEMREGYREAIRKYVDKKMEENC